LRELPKKTADFDIILICAICGLSLKREYPEKELNAELQRWILQVGGNLGIDHVTLRRYLVDAGLLRRDSSGSQYQVQASGHNFTFDSDIPSLDLAALLSAAEQERAERKRQRQAKSQDA
jgi:hypothetical protein